MSIAEQVARIRGEKSKIAIKLSTMGLADQTADLKTLADAIDGIHDNGAVTATVRQGESYTIPEGYHNGSGSVAGLDNPDADASKYMRQTKTITPTKSQQSVTPDQGYYGLSSVTVNAIPAAFQDVSQVDATKDDVLAGKKIVTASGAIVVGEMKNQGAKQLFLGRANEKDDWISMQYISKGYHDGDGFVYIDTEIPDPVTPKLDAQIIKPSVGKVLKQVTVNPISYPYKDISVVTALPHHVLKGYKFVDKEGDLVEGTITQKGAANTNIDLTVEESVTFDAGYYSSVTVGITSDLENALKEI